MDLVRNVVRHNTPRIESDPRKVFSIKDIIWTDKFKINSYSGSLTTPNCSQNVKWMVSMLPLEISSADLATFRSLLDGTGKPITKNFRPVQNLNGRIFISNK